MSSGANIVTCGYPVTQALFKVTTPNGTLPYTSYTDNNISYWVYTFTDTSIQYTLNFSNLNTDITFNCLAVGGGGGGAYGGGGAGGMLEQTYTVSSADTSSQKIYIMVGAGSASYSCVKGGDTTIGTTISATGGGFGSYNSCPDGGSGGSGGGGDPGEGDGVAGYSGGLAQPTDQGFDGGSGGAGGSSSGGYGGGGGGGGANGYGGPGLYNDNDANPPLGGAGGAGKQPNLDGIPNTTVVDGVETPIYYAIGGSGYDSTQVSPVANSGNGGSWYTYGSSGIVIIAIPTNAAGPGG